MKPKKAESGNGDESKKTPAHFPIVGVGGSAGGLEAFKELLQHLRPPTGMAFVFVQHLDPSHESLLSHMLAEATSMPVHPVTDGMAVEPNHVYVLPQANILSISNSTLYLSSPEIVKGRRLSIDVFFQSLADDAGPRAIGVLLSGNANDGTLGLEAIKAAGGMTFAQDEKSARNPSMPRHAAAIGCVDFVLPPRRIAEELVKISREADLISGRMADRAVEHEQFARIFRLLQKATQIDFSSYKLNTIGRRVRRRMVLNKSKSMEEYVRLLESHQAEVHALCQDILIKVTGFFRDPDVFAALEEKAFPAILGSASRAAPIRFWVPACSTGEEAYSLAISMQEFLNKRQSAIPFQLFATDVSEPAIERARLGVYPDRIALDVSPARLRRFFTKVDSGFQISKAIREVCVFARQDVTRDPPFSKIDLISCRNLLIYLEPVLQKKVIPVFHYALKPNGFLLLGSSETIGAFPALFSPVDKKQKIYSRRLRAEGAFMFSEGPSLRVEEKSAGPPPQPQSWAEQDFHKEVDRLLLNRYAPAAIVLNESLEIIHFRGHTSPYIGPTAGKASLNILKMVRDSLSFELRNVLHKAVGHHIQVRADEIAFRADGELKRVNLEVIPLKGPVSGTHYFLVLFEEPKAVLPAPAEPAAPKPAEGRETRGAPTESAAMRELFETRDQLQSIVEEQEATNEELQSANEEVMSANEELQSTNEELETAKEELQSTNEELTTVNEELQNRNLEMSQVNNDLANLLAGVNIPIVMLSADLRIRRYTPSAEKLFNMIPADIGRPLTDLKPNIHIPDFDALISGVIDKLSPVSLMAQDTNGLWYDVQARPYKTADNRIVGAVLTLLKVSSHPQAERETAGVKRK